MEKTEQTITVPVKVNIMNGGKVGHIYNQGDLISIPAQDAVFLIYPNTSCADGSVDNNCSKQMPLFCASGVLTDNCKECGCPDGQLCQSDGSCKGEQSISCEELGKPIAQPNGTLSLADIGELESRFLKLSKGPGVDVNKDCKFSQTDVYALLQCYSGEWAKDTCATNPCGTVCGMSQ
jgi:hypothetical protein